MLKILFISIVLVGISFLGMALRMLIIKGGKFPEFRVGHNKAMRKKGITCVKHDEIKCHRKNLRQEACESCSPVLNAGS